ncbi:hypothetical protein ABZP36_023252 [Zizania latifolia]
MSIGAGAGGGVVAGLAAAGSGAAPHVLAVDDSSVDRAVIAGILRSSRFRVTTVDSGKRALELLGSLNCLDMYSLEIQFDDANHAPHACMQGSSKLKKIPVVIMSSENVPTRISRCLEEGAEDFLVKPVRPSDVSRLFSRVLP